MKKFIIIAMIFIFPQLALGFSNSLDGTSHQSSFKQNNNFAAPNNNTYQNRQNTPFVPKTHSGFEHQNNQFPSSSMEGTRFNTDCQFGVCLPGGVEKERNNN